MAERKVAEQALLVSEQRYQSLLASTTDYVYTVTMDHGRALATSHGPGCEAVTGFTSREFDADTSLWYRIVDLHGGAIAIRNAPQGGACVTLILKRE